MSASSTGTARGLSAGGTRNESKGKRTLFIVHEQKLLFLPASQKKLVPTQALFEVVRSLI